MLSGRFLSAWLGHRPPSVLIIGGCFLAIFLGGGLLPDAEMKVLPEGYRGMAPLAWATGFAIVGLDVWFRRSNGYSLFSLKASTIFYVIPTWVVGVGFLVAGLRWWGEA